MSQEDIFFAEVHDGESDVLSMIVDMHLHLDIFRNGSAGTRSAISTIDQDRAHDFLCCKVSGCDKA